MHRQTRSRVRPAARRAGQWRDGRRRQCGVDLDRDTAHLWALVEAQHVLRQDPARHLLLRNVYDVDAIRGEDGWLIASMTARTVWSDGDGSVLFG